MPFQPPALSLRVTENQNASILGEVTNTFKTLEPTNNPEAPSAKEKPNDEIRKLKITLSDTLFDLKKVEEDFAQYKRVIKIQKEKETKKWEETVNKLKNEIECLTEDAAYKANTIEEAYQTKITNLKKIHQETLNQQLEQLKTSYETQLEVAEKCRAREVNQLTQKHRKVLADWRQKSEREFQETKTAYEGQLRDCLIQRKQVIDQKEKQYESFKVGLQSEKKIEEKMHEKTKVDGAKERERLLGEICFQRNMKIQAESQLVEKDKRISSLKSQISKLEVDLQLSAQRHQRRLTEAETACQQDKDQLRLHFETETKELLNANLGELEAYETKIKVLEETHQTVIESMKITFEQLSKALSSRPSRREDMTQIDRLKQSLQKKEEECCKLLRELKHCNLELQNKEDIYTRIFKGGSVSKHQKKSLQKVMNAEVEEKTAREAVFRKSHTADIKFLLKIYNQK